MSNDPNLPAYEVAVAVIQCGDRILLRYNADWGVFSLPMCKRRNWAFAEEIAREPWIDAAARAVAECVGKTSVPEFLLEMRRAQFSDRDGACKNYHFGIFRHTVDAESPLVLGIVGEWVELSAIKQRRPLSSTVAAIVDELQKQRIL